MTLQELWRDCELADEYEFRGSSDTGLLRYRLSVIENGVKTGAVADVTIRYPMGRYDQEFDVRHVLSLFPVIEVSPGRRIKVVEALVGYYAIEVTPI